MFKQLCGKSSRNQKQFQSYSVSVHSSASAVKQLSSHVMLFQWLAHKSRTSLHLFMFFFPSLNLLLIIGYTSNSLTMLYAVTSIKLEY